MELIELYLQEVKKSLVGKKKNDIIDELRSSIMDELNDDFSEENISKVINALGDPKLLAYKYMNSSEIILSGKYYAYCADTLKKTVPIILAIIFTINCFTNINALTTSHPLPIIGTLFFSLIQSFWIVVTISLYIILVFIIVQKVSEYSLKNQPFSYETEWNANKFYKENKYKIKKYGISTSAFIFTTIFTILSYIFLWIFSTAVIDINETEYIFFNGNYAGLLLFAIVASFIFVQGLLTIRFIDQKYSFRYLVITIIQSIWDIIMSYLILIKLNMFFIPTNLPKVSEYLKNINLYIFLSIVVIVVIQLISVIIKYNHSKNK